MGRGNLVARDDASLETMDGRDFHSGARQILRRRPGLAPRPITTGCRLWQARRSFSDHHNALWLWIPGLRPTSLRAVGLARDDIEDEACPSVLTRNVARTPALSRRVSRPSYRS